LDAFLSLRRSAFAFALRRFFFLAFFFAEL
jgi:hypothetical protein